MHVIFQKERAVLTAVEQDQDPAEMRELASTAGVEIAGEYYQRRNEPDPASYLGRGKVQELS